MTTDLSPDAQAILMLTAPLLTGRGGPSPDLLSPGAYKRLARHLGDLGRRPADLLSAQAPDLLRGCAAIVEETRLRRLLERGFLLSQAVERWQTRAIWVTSSADPGYPRRLRTVLGENAPAVLYGCGEIGLLEAGGLAVVGSRDADDASIGDAANVGRLAAEAGTAIVSGGARGIDQAAMRGALDAGGKAVGVVADSLEKAAMHRDNRKSIVDGRLVLASPYDPGAGFNIGNAMQRNKLIYALSDAALVMNCDLDKGGTWAGATEQLDRLRLVPVYIRSIGESSPGIEALRRKGALDWPNPQDVRAFNAVFEGRRGPVQGSLFE